MPDKALPKREGVLIERPALVSPAIESPLHFRRETVSALGSAVFGDEEVRLRPTPGPPERERRAEAPASAAQRPIRTWPVRRDTLGLR